MTAEKALLFEPNSPATRRFLETMVPHLESKVEQREYGSLGKGRDTLVHSDLPTESSLVQVGRGRNCSSVVSSGVG